MKSFKLAYKITEPSSWRSKDGIDIKSNLADDELIDCQLAKSLIETLKTESTILEPDKLILAIAEAQKREIETSLSEMDDMAIQAKVHADKAHEILSTIVNESGEKYLEIEKKFSETEAKFNTKLTTTATKIKKSMEELSTVEEKLNQINNFSLEKLTDVLKQLIKLVNTDPELVKLVLEHKKK